MLFKSSRFDRKTNSQGKGIGAEGRNGLDLFSQGRAHIFQHRWLNTNIAPTAACQKTADSAETETERERRCQRIEHRQQRKAACCAIKQNSDQPEYNAPIKD